jgi:hypothetical protein
VEQRYHLKVWKRGMPGDYVRVRWRCRSWRHRGACAKHRSREDFERIWYAVAGERPEDVAFLVLTLNREDWRDQWDAYERLRERWRSLAKALRRHWGRMAYVATVEAHKDGWPHLNVILACPALAAEARRRHAWVVAWLKRRAVRCGFGYRLTIEGARDLRTVAGYVVKLADTVGELPAGLDGVGASVAGEVAKLSQVPVTAPKGFRRLRSSPGFLPPAPKSEEWTGTLETMPHPDTLPPEKAAALRYFDAMVRGEPAEHLRPAGLGEEPEVDPQRALLQDGRRVFVLDVGAPPEGEEWVDGAWRELEAAWEDGQGPPGLARAGQLELF